MGKGTLLQGVANPNKLGKKLPLKQPRRSILDDLQQAFEGDEYAFPTGEQIENDLDEPIDVQAKFQEFLQVLISDDNPINIAYLDIGRQIKLKEKEVREEYGEPFQPTEEILQIINQDRDNKRDMNRADKYLDKIIEDKDDVEEVVPSLDRLHIHVLAPNYWKCLNHYNNAKKQNFQGKWTVIVAVPKTAMIRAIRESDRYIEITPEVIEYEHLFLLLHVTFKYYQLYNSQFGTLSFMVNDHSTSDLFRSSVFFVCSTANALCHTGAFNGMRAWDLKHSFSSFVITLTLNFEAKTTMNPDLEVSYKRFVFGPYPMHYLTGPTDFGESIYGLGNEEDSEDEMENKDRNYYITAFSLKLQEDIDKKIEELRNEADYGSIFDIDSYPAEMRDEFREQGNDEKVIKNNIFQRRMESVIIKFFPASSMLPNRRATHLLEPNRLIPKVITSSIDPFPTIDIAMAESIDNVYPKEAVIDENVDLEELSVGCILEPKEKIPSTLLKDAGLWNMSPDNSNNCFIQCYMEALKRAGRPLNPILYKSFQEVREKIGNIKHQDLISLKEAQVFADHQYIELHFYSIVDCNLSSQAETVLEKMERESILKTLNERNAGRVARRVQNIGKIFVTNTMRQDTQGRTLLMARLFVHNQHCYLINEGSRLTEKTKCSICGQWPLISTWVNHRQTCRFCSVCHGHYSTKNGHVNCKGVQQSLTNLLKQRKGMSKSEGAIPSDKTPLRVNPTQADRTQYSNQQFVQKIYRDRISSAYMKKTKPEEEMMDHKKIYVADLEAFYDSLENAFVPYAAGVVRLNQFFKTDNKGGMNAIKIFYGLDCMTHLFEYLKKAKGTLIYYNGSGFDNYIHLKYKIENEMEILNEGFIKNNGRILSFKDHSYLRVIDMYLFIKSSLENACAAWKVPPQYCKTGFDHNKIYSKETAFQHYVEVQDYLKHDVAALACLTKNYQETMFKCFGRDPLQCVTPSQYAVEVWRMMCPVIEDIKKSGTGADEITDRAAYYGGMKKK